MATGPTPSPIGIVLVDKPQGMTSNQVLGRIKRLFGQKKAGHTGTLDPMATGLLIICLGHATKVSAHLLDADKAYEARVHLGVVTDTEDAEGQVVGRHPVHGLTSSTVEAVLEHFKGPIQQVPPMYSALKHEGERLYALARRGETIDRPARAVTIHALTASDWALDDPTAPGFSLHIRCSKGTYIRSLVRDIGQALGCGAHLSALRRTASAPYDLTQAQTLEALDAMGEHQRSQALLPITSSLPHWPKISIDRRALSDFQQGRCIELMKQAQPATKGQWVFVMFEDVCVGLAEITDQGLQPRSVFV